jgi:ferrous iron transport protein A
VKSALNDTDPRGDTTLVLAQLRRGQEAVVVGLADVAAIDAGRGVDDSLIARLRDLGFVPGAHCEVVARMWFGGDPMAVRIGGSTFALRRAEAAAVRVQLVLATAPATRPLAQPESSAAPA